MKTPFIFLCFAAFLVSFSQTSVAQTKLASYERHTEVVNLITFYKGGGRITMEQTLDDAKQHEAMMKPVFEAAKVPVEFLSVRQALQILGLEDENGLWRSGGQGLKDPQKETAETAKLFKSLLKKYKSDIGLSLAAYFAGEQKIDSALSSSKTKTYTRISAKLDEPTRNFVANSLTAMMIAKNPKRYGFE